MASIASLQLINKSTWKFFLKIAENIIDEIFSFIWSRSTNMTFTLNLSLKKIK